MQKATILLALAGDAGNSVTKYDVTAAEVALLQAIHGNDSISDIEITGEAEDDGKKRTNRQELARLRQIYAPSEMASAYPIFNSLYPGAAARVFESFDELELPDDLFVAKSRATPESVAENGDPAKGLDDMTKDELVAEAKRRDVDVDASAKKADILAKLKASEQAGSLSDDDDGVDDMNDNVLG